MAEQKDWLQNEPNVDADIVITFHPDAEQTTVLWLKEKIEQICGIVLNIKPLAMSSNSARNLSTSRITCTAFYIKATYKCYLHGLEQMRIPKILKEELGGGRKEFTLKDCHSFKLIQDMDSFLTSQERQSSLVHILNHLRADKGI